MHTPTPWTLDLYHGPHGDSVQVRSEKACIASVDMDLRGGVGAPTQDDNGAFIVQACNAHDALVAALQAALPYLKSYAIYTYGGKDYDAALSKVHYALALATPKEAVR